MGAASAGLPRPRRCRWGAPGARHAQIWAAGWPCMSTDWRGLPGHTCRPPSPSPQAHTAACLPAEPHFHQSEYYPDGAAAMWQQAAQQPQLAFVPTAADYAAVCEPGLAASYPGTAGWQQGAAYSGGYLPMVTGGPQQLAPEPQPAPDALGERVCRPGGPWPGPVPCRTALPRPECTCFLPPLAWSAARNHPAHHCGCLSSACLHVTRVQPAVRRWQEAAALVGGASRPLCRRRQAAGCVAAPSNGQWQQKRHVSQAAALVLCAGGPLQFANCPVACV